MGSRCGGAVSWPFALGHWRPDGDADSQYRFSWPGVDGDRAAVALHDDAPCDVEAQAGAFADVLGRVKGLEGAGRHLRRHARAGVADLDDDVVAFGPGRQPERARAGHGVDGVVDEVGPYLVQLAGVCLDPRDVCAVVTHDRDTVAELVPEHQQGALNAVGHVNVLHRRAVHLRVGLDGGDQLGNAPARILQL